MSTVASACGTVEIGFIAARTRRISPGLVPPPGPPAPAPVCAAFLVRVELRGEPSGRVGIEHPNRRGVDRVAVLGRRERLAGPDRGDRHGTAETPDRPHP